MLYNRPRKPSFWEKIRWLLLLAVIAANAYSIFFWKVTSFQVRGSDLYEDNEVISFLKNTKSDWRFKLLGFNNFWSWKEDILIPQSSLLSAVAQITIKKDLLARIVEIEVDERVGYGVFCVGETKADNCYWFDSDGIVFREAQTIVDDIILRVEELTEKQPVFGSPFLERDRWNYLRELLNYIKDQQLPIQRITLQRSLDSATIQLLGPKLFFSLGNSATKQLSALDAFRKKFKIEKFEYLDFRTEDKIFYKAL